MVNSKRMSKSKVAMIALAILLVLSLILTATGAWFTNNATSTAEAPTASFRNSYMTVSIDKNEDAIMTVDRDKNGDGTAEVYKLVTALTETNYSDSELAGEILNTDLMPGDDIKSNQSLTATFSAPVGQGAYYLIGKKASDASTYTWYVTYSEAGTKTPAQAAGANLPKVTAEQSLVLYSGSHHLLLTGSNYGNSALGTDIDMSVFEFDDFCVRMIQAENLTPSAAYDILTGYTWSADADPVANS